MFIYIYIHKYICIIIKKKKVQLLQNTEQKMNSAHHYCNSQPDRVVTTVSVCDWNNMTAGVRSWG